MIGQIAKINIDKAKNEGNQHFALVEWAEKEIRVKIETEPTKLNDLSNTTIVSVRALEGNGVKGRSMPTIAENLDIIKDLNEYPFWEKVKAKIKCHFTIYIRVWKRKGEGIRIFGVDPYAPGRINVSKSELKRQERYILDNKLNEKEAYEYRHNEVYSYCNRIRARNEKLMHNYNIKNKKEV